MNTARPDRPVQRRRRWRKRPAPAKQSPAAYTFSPEQYVAFTPAELEERLDEKRGRSGVRALVRALRILLNSGATAAEPKDVG